MKMVSDVTIQLFGKTFGVRHAWWGSSGAIALVLVNKRTGAVLPTTAMARLANPLHVEVYTEGGILGKLEEAKIVQRVAEREQCGGFRLTLCEVIHPEVVTWVKENAAQRDEGRTRFARECAPQRDGRDI